MILPLFSNLVDTSNKEFTSHGKQYPLLFISMFPLDWLMHWEWKVYMVSCCSDYYQYSNTLGLGLWWISNLCCHVYVSFTPRGKLGSWNRLDGKESLAISPELLIKWCIVFISFHFILCCLLWTDMFVVWCEICML